MSPPAQTPRLPLLATDWGMLAGTLITLVGYLSPWFRKGRSAQWSFSGWEYASLSDGGGWTLLTFGWLLLAAGAALFAREYLAAAVTGMTAGVGTLVTCLLVVAASFGAVGGHDSMNPVVDRPFGAGLPIMTLGLALLLATSCLAIVRCHRLEAGHDRPAAPRRPPADPDA